MHVLSLARAGLPPTGVAVRVNHIEFGDCAVGKLCDKTFAVTNRSKEEVMRFEWPADAPFQFSPKVGHLQPGRAKDIKVTLKSNVPVTFKRHSVTCKVAKIKYQLPPEEDYDWDDEMRMVQWEDTSEKRPGARWPLKRKVARALQEPSHTVLGESSYEVELSARVGYAKYKLDTAEVQFKKTELFQTETSTFQMYNTGNIALKYSWEVALEEERPLKRAGKPFSKTLMSCFLPSAAVEQRLKPRAKPLESAEPKGTEPKETQPKSTQPKAAQPQTSTQAKPTQAKPTQPQSSPDRSKQPPYSLKPVSSSMESLPDDINDPPLFSVEPHCGTIPAGQKQIFHVKFCPMHVGKFKAKILCSLSNLKSSQKSPSLSVMGEGHLPKTDQKRTTSLPKGETQSSKPKKKVQSSK
ncbi:hydrocephalus-inducing protein homolog [Myiozetetes cayanensis]|uniref:hydrocephalus-inducing protein homolog n=1 Tax=Myiozetetes cayanensis TaxID=478635 RepID=UPI00215DE319|nr:hydrocephalus-inducing protein homolog [Myiozetetes cayanensis]